MYSVYTVSVTWGLSKHKLRCEIMDFSMDAKPINYKAHYLKPELNASCVCNEKKKYLHVFSCVHKKVIVNC